MADLDSGLTDSELVQAVQTTAHQKIKRGTDYLVADGVTDDTAALQTLLNGGGIIDLRGMTIALESTVTISATDGKVYILGDDCTINYTGTRTRRIFLQEGTHDYFQIDGAEINGNNNAMEAFYFWGSYKVTSCHIHHVATELGDDVMAAGIAQNWGSVAKTFYSEISSCKIHDIYGESNSTLMDFQGAARGAAISSSYQQGDSKIKIVDNEIFNIYGEEGDGITIDYVDNSADDNATKQARIDNSRISILVDNNNIYRCNRRALKLRHFNTMVSNNTFRLYKSGDAENINQAGLLSIVAQDGGLMHPNNVIVNNKLVNEGTALTATLHIGGQTNLIVSGNEIRNVSDSQKQAIAIGNVNTSIDIFDNTIEGDGCLQWTADGIHGKVTVRNNRILLRSDLYKTPIFNDSSSGNCASFVADGNIAYAGSASTEGFLDINHSTTNEFFGECIISNNKYLRDDGGSAKCQIAKFYVIYDNPLTATDKYKFLNNYSNGDGSEMFYVYAGANADATVRLGNIKNTAEMNDLTLAV